MRTSRTVLYSGATLRQQNFSNVRVGSQSSVCGKTSSESTQTGPFELICTFKSTSFQFLYLAELHHKTGLMRLISLICQFLICSFASIWFQICNVGSIVKLQCKLLRSKRSQCCFT